MTFLMFLIAAAMIWLGLHLLIKLRVEQAVEHEVDRRLAERDGHVQQQLGAVLEIRDELRSTSHQMISTALEAGVREQIDTSDFERSGS